MGHTGQEVGFTTVVGVVGSVTLRRFYVTSCVVLVNILDLLHKIVPAGRLRITGLYSSTPGQVLIAIRGHGSVQAADQIYAAEGE